MDGVFSGPSFQAVASIIFLRKAWNSSFGNKIGGKSERCGRERGQGRWGPRRKPPPSRGVPSTVHRNKQLVETPKAIPLDLLEQKMGQLKLRKARTCRRPHRWVGWGGSKLGGCFLTPWGLCHHTTLPALAKEHLLHRFGFCQAPWLGGHGSQSLTASSPRTAEPSPVPRGHVLS